MKTPYLHKNVPAVPAGPNLSHRSEFYVGGVAATGARTQAVRISVLTGTVVIRRVNVPDLIAALERYMAWADGKAGGHAS